MTPPMPLAKFSKPMRRGHAQIAVAGRGEQREAEFDTPISTRLISTDRFMPSRA